MKRVLIVSSVFPNTEDPRFGTFVAERARAYSRHAEVVVVAPIPWFPRWAHHPVFGGWGLAGRVAEESRLDGIRVLHPRRLVVPKIGGILAGYFYARCLRRVLASVRETFPFQVVDAHFAWPDGYAATAALQGSGIPVCVTAQGTDLNLMPRYHVIHGLIAKALQRATRVLSVCRSLAEECAQLGCPGAKIRVVPPGVSPHRFPLISRQRARSELGLAPDARYIICVGALIPRKGQRVLIEALRRLRGHERHGNLELILIGDGPDGRALRSFAARRGVAPQVHFVGAVEHDALYPWLCASDVFALASQREGWPTVFFEAMACGLPVVATDVNGAPEAIDSPQLGSLVPPDDPFAMAAALDGVLATSWDRGLLRERAIANTWDRVASETLAIFDETIRDHRP